MSEYEWQLHPQAEALVDRLVAEAIGKSAELAAFTRRLAAQTATRAQDWLDSVTGPVTVDELAAVGYQPTDHAGLWRHAGAQLPAVVPAEHYELALRVDDIAALAASHARETGASAAQLEGSPLAGFRRVVLAEQNGVVLAGVERRSWAAGNRPQTFQPSQASAASQAWQLLAERPRTLSGPAGVRAQLPAARAAVELVGLDLAASYFLQQERGYWQRHNTAGALQHARQDRLGLGWGNNDHHTFRSSRAAFAPLIEFLTLLGFGSRERFYAGAQAGWGAQVLEHPGCGGVIFADVDLLAGEVDLDFSQVELAETGRHGTVGMWCALHGESLLAAGMHHLEGQFSFDELTTSLAELGQPSMRPFSDYPYLRQAFTEADWWPVPAARLDALVTAGQLEPRRAAEIAENGAAGSHLENLARRSGFKGFNQANVSATMAATDPREYRR
ncbi:MAG TPA: hypothetical protein VGB75_13970 [Jatrophihabitans sp.]|jgi:hypothetical protein|uniref:hypothetical protein n=1 Tax=Jatrophihabitans sp. TaxID=1932789 RepID=UPI002F07B333